MPVAEHLIDREMILGKKRCTAEWILADRCRSLRGRCDDEVRSVKTLASLVESDDDDRRVERFALLLESIFWRLRNGLSRLEDEMLRWLKLCDE